MLLLSHSTSVMCPSTPNFEKCCHCLSISIIQCCTCQQVFPGAALLRSMGGGRDVGVVSFLVYLVASCRWCDGRLVWALVCVMCLHSNRMVVQEKNEDEEGDEWGRRAISQCACTLLLPVPDLVHVWVLCSSELIPCTREEEIFYDTEYSITGLLFNEVDVFPAYSYLWCCVWILTSLRQLSLWQPTLLCHILTQVMWFGLTRRETDMLKKLKEYADSWRTGFRADHWAE